MKLLLLRLEGPLQSWGEHAKWDERDSAALPTKSGVIGLVACAMGLPRGDPRLLKLSQKLHLAVRADRPGRLIVDFHTVQGMPVMMNAQGARRSGNTIISRRQYLQDASFLAVLWGDGELLLQSAEALRSPVWPPYLGRKSCVPSVPLVAELTDHYASVEEALAAIPAPRARRQSFDREGKLLPPTSINAVTQIEQVQPGPGWQSALRMDQCVDPAARHFAGRYTKNGKVAIVEGEPQ